MRKFVRIVAAVSFAAVVLVAGPTPAAQAGDSVTITVEKVIVGEAPDGAEFVVAFDCGQAGVDEFTFTADDLSPQTTFALLGDCTLSETANAGADAVTYACVASGPGVGSCVPGATAVDIEFVSNSGGGDAFITVTNTFEAEPEPVPQTTSVSVPSPATVVAPTFTG